MGGPSASTSNCSHEKKESISLKMLRLEIVFAVCVAGNRSEVRRVGFTGNWVD